MATLMREIADAIFAAFLLPGNFLLSLISGIFPTVATVLTATDDDTLIAIVIFTALLTWFTLAFAIRLAARFARNVAWIVGTRFRIFLYRWSLAISKITSFLVRKIQQLTPRRTRVANDISRVDFDEIDLAVLLSAAARGPGLATSALELADQLTWRPAEIQQSLDKLTNNKMLVYAFGSTDGFDTYCLSQLGASFTDMLRSRHRSSA